MSAATMAIPKLAAVKTSAIAPATPFFCPMPERSNSPIKRLDGSSMPNEVGSFGRHRKGTFLAIFARQPYGSVKCHPTAPALRYLTATNACSGHSVFTMGIGAVFRGLQVHADLRTLD